MNVESLVDVVIPAFNEEQSLPLVFEDLPRVRNVIVVNNDSTDNTASVAEERGAVVAFEAQRGYGAACLKGLSTIRERIEAGESEPQVVVFLDADYSDHPQYLTQLVEPIFAGDADFVLGSRILGEREPGAMPMQSIYGNKLACFLMRWLFGVKYTDLGPFRAIDYQSLRSLGMIDENFGWTIEMQPWLVPKRLIKRQSLAFPATAGTGTYRLMPTSKANPRRPKLLSELTADPPPTHDWWVTPIRTK